MTIRQMTATVLIMGLITAPVMAGSTMPVTVAGNAIFQQDGDNWTITTATDKTIINWNSFDVAQGAHVHFQQPSAASSVLNRVLGPQASHINGLLSSNGAVYLFNPNGIVIGHSGVIRVADFMASTLLVTDAEFLAGGDMNFKGMSSASIENYGKIEAIGGEIYLIAANVVNKGTLTASAGSVNLVAAIDVLLTQDHKIFIRPSLLTNAAGIGIENSGIIDAIVARLQADGNMYALAINNSGVIRVTGSAIADGRVFLLAEDGSLVNTGSLVARNVQADGKTAGGEIQVLGDDIAVTGAARIDASGDLGGGRILIGGDLQGANPSVPNAETTLVGSDAVIASDALVEGNGGTVIVWSNGATTVSGTISALGAAGGAGGFVETSGHTLDVAGIDLACGNGGTWLIDPPYLEINPIWRDLIEFNLNAGTSMWIRNSIDGPGKVGINVIAPISATPPNPNTYLWLDADVAGADILISADIDVGGGILALSAKAGVTQVAGTTVKATGLFLDGSGNFSLNQPGNDFGTIAAVFDVSGNIVTIQDVNDIAIGEVASMNGLKVPGGDVHITTPNGHILVNGLFPAGMVTGYHARGNVSIAEAPSALPGSYRIVISNENTEGYAKLPLEVEPFVGLVLGDLNDLRLPDINNKGSGVRIEFGELAGDSLGYGWDFWTAETLAEGSANDYSFVVVKPTGPVPPQVLADVEAARTSGNPTSENGCNWFTGEASETVELNHTDPYTLNFGVMHVEHEENKSLLYVTNVFYGGHFIVEDFVFERIWDHVEDFPHIRPDLRVSNINTQIQTAFMLDEVSTYFDESAQATDHRYYYQSVGSIYQIPR